jgi:hypothetical protein
VRVSLSVCLTTVVLALGPLSATSACPFSMFLDLAPAVSVSPSAASEYSREHPLAPLCRLCVSSSVTLPETEDATTAMLLNRASNRA